MNDNLSTLRNVKIPPIGSVSTRKAPSKVKGSESFADVLKRKTDSQKVVFSKHADARLKLRNIELTSSQLGKLNEGLNIARNKGIKDSLIVVEDLSFIVNVGSATVVTAMADKTQEPKIFTNIDGAVII